MMQLRRGISALRWPGLYAVLACAFGLILLTVLVVSGAPIPGDSE